MSLRTTITNASYKGYQSVGSGGGPTGSWAFFESEPVYDWSSAKIANNSQYMAVQYSLNNLVTVLDNSTGIWSETDSNISLLNPSGTKRSTGYSINADGTYVSIGGLTGSTTGTVNILTRTGNTFALQQTITPNDAPKLNFGAATALNYNGDKLLVGESGNISANTIGSVYYFTRSGNTWTQQQKFTWTGANINQLNISVQFPEDDTKCIINAFNSNSASIFYFTRSGNTWTEQQQVTTSPGEVLISGDANTIIQNYAGRTAAPTSDAAVGIYKWNGSNAYVFSQTINNPIGAAPQNFGVGLGTNYNATMICTGSGIGAVSAVQRNYIFTIVYNSNTNNYVVSENFTIPNPKNVFIPIASDNNWLIAPVNRSSPDTDETYIYQRI